MLRELWESDAIVDADPFSRLEHALVRAEGGGFMVVAVDALILQPVNKTLFQEVGCLDMDDFPLFKVPRFFPGEVVTLIKTGQTCIITDWKVADAFDAPVPWENAVYEITAKESGEIFSKF